MGKVQDTISKFGGRAGGRESHSDIALQVPGQQPTKADSFPTDVKAVARYLEALPSSAASSTPEVIRALQHSNRLMNTPANRLQIARLFEPVVQTALTDLDAGFIDIHLPYPTSATTDFEQATGLLQEMAVCYKIILLDVLRRRGQLARKHRLPVIYQAMKHLAECGLRYSQSYQAWPDKIWRDLNTLYLCAEREQGTDTELRQGNNPKTIRQRYSQCCAFSACRGAQLPPLYQSQLYRLLGKHSDVIDLVDTSDHSRSDSVYSVALDSAHPPSIGRYSRYLDTQVVRFFNIEPLLDLLAVSETDIEKDLSSQTIINDMSDQTHRVHLRKVTDNSAKRRHPRSVRQTILQTEAGLKEIHTSLLPSYQNSISAASGHYQRQYGTQWILQNHSKGGVGLKWTGKGNCRVGIGELIAHSEQTNQEYATGVNWHIGIVRWIQSDGQTGLQCGVETLASYATAVTACHALTTSDTPDQTSSTEALLINDHPAASRPPMLLSPKQVYRIGERVTIQSDNGNRLVRLVEHYPVGGSFQCFGFEPASFNRSTTR